MHGSESPSLEVALERLDVLVKEMEEGSLPLESLIAKYEEGMGLVKTCEDKLCEAERRIQVIARAATGEPVLEDFEVEDNG